ncbi:MAG: hypothetical protein ACFCUQ_03515 [Kiloniellales bacterium]
MTTSRKFLFDNSFDPQPQVGAKPEPAPGKPQPAPEPSFTRAELEAARAEGFAAGREQGQGEARATAERAIAQTLAAIDTALSSLLAQQGEALAAHERSAFAAGVTIVRKLFPRLAAREAMSEIEQVIEDCLKRLRSEPRIVVRVADALLDQLREHLDSLLQRAGFEGKIVLLADETLAADAVRVEWADGGAERDSGEIWQAIDGVLERALGSVQSNGISEQHHGEPQAPTAPAPARTVTAEATAGSSSGLTQPA